MVLFQDETFLREFPPLRACWAKVGEQARVPITGSNARRCVLGVLNPETGTRRFLRRTRNRKEDFCAFLRYLRSLYKRWDLLLVLDQASSHTAKVSRALAEELRITLAWLPTACPELNPVELLWKDGKTDVSANRTYETVDQQACAFVNHLLEMNPQEALQTAGVLSNNFWLST